MTNSSESSIAPSPDSVEVARGNRKLWGSLLLLWVVLGVFWSFDLVRYGLHTSAVAGLGLAIASGCLAISQTQSENRKRKIWLSASFAAMAVTMGVKILMARH